MSVRSVASSPRHHREPAPGLHRDGPTSPVEVLRAPDSHQAVRVRQFGEAADLVVLLERGSDGHDDGDEPKQHESQTQRGGWRISELAR